jgi:hypothetical protein
VVVIHGEEVGVFDEESSHWLLAVSFQRLVVRRLDQSCLTTLV